MKLEIDTRKIADDVVTKALEKEIHGKTLKQWIEEMAKRQWISVHEKKPEMAIPVLIWLGAGSEIKTEVPLIGRYSPSDESWTIYGLDADITKRMKITHWMQMPEPPIEEAT